MSHSVEYGLLEIAKLLKSAGGKTSEELRQLINAAKQPKSWVEFREAPIPVCSEASRIALVDAIEKAQPLLKGFAPTATDLSILQVAAGLKVTWPTGDHTHPVVKAGEWYDVFRHWTSSLSIRMSQKAKDVGDELVKIQVERVASDTAARGSSAVQPSWDSAEAEPKDPIAPGYIPLSMADEEFIKDAEKRFGKAAANAVRAEKLAAERQRRAMSDLTSEPREVPVTLRIPTAKDLPYMVLNLFFLLASLYQVNAPSVEIKFKEEELGTQMSYQFGEKDVEALIAERLRLETDLGTLKATETTTPMPALEKLLSEKIAEVNRAINMAQSAQKWEIGSHITKLPEKTYRFPCKPEDVAQVTAIIRRWRLYRGETLPSHEELTARSDYLFKTPLPAASFRNGSTETRSKKEDIISSILNLRAAAPEALRQLAAKINSLSEYPAKIANIYDKGAYPEWVQKAFAESKNLTTTIKTLLTQVQEKINKEKLTKEDTAFIAATARLEKKQLDEILKKNAVTSLYELPVVWKMALTDAINKVNPIDFLRQLYAGELKPEDLYEVPEIKPPKKKTYAEIIKGAVSLKSKPAPKKVGYVSSDLNQAWTVTYNAKTIPDYVGQMYVDQSELTMALVKQQLIEGLSGVQNGKAWKTLPTNATIQDFLSTVYKLGYQPTGQQMPLIRAAIIDGRLRRVAEKTPIGVFVPSHEELSKRISELPGSSGSKPEEGRKNSGGNPTPKNKGKQNSGGGKGKSNPNPSGGKSPKADKPKAKDSNNGSSRQPASGNNKPDGSKSTPASPAKGTKGRQVSCGGVSYTVSDLLNRVSQAEGANKKFVVIGNDSFNPKFLRKLLSTKDVASVGSRFGSDGKPKVDAKGSKPAPTKGKTPKSGVSTKST